MAGCVEKVLHFRRLAEHGPFVLRARPQTGPRVNLRERRERVRDLKSVRLYPVNPFDGHATVEARAFGGRACEQTPIASRDDVAARAVDDVTDELRVRVRLPHAEHLPAHRLDA